MSSNQNLHVGIVGGGVIGLFTAHYLARSGARVTVMERDSRMGSGASRGNSGQIVMAKPLPSPGMVRAGLRSMIGRSGAFYVTPSAVPGLTGFLSRFMLQSTGSRYERGLQSLAVLNELTMPLLDELLAEGVGGSLGTTGNLRVFADQATAEADHAGAVARAGRGMNEHPGALMYGQQLWDYEPALGMAARFGYILPGLRWGDPSALMDELIVALDDAGVELVTDSAVTAVKENGSNVTVVHGAQRSTFSHVVLAAGPWNSPLLKAAGVRIVLEPGMGYSFTVRSERIPGHLLALETAHVGVTPMGENRLRIAGTMEFTGTDRGRVGDRIRAISATAKPFLAGVDWESVSDEWGAARPMTPDGLPYIGPLPGHSRTLLATGHNMLGLTLGPATGYKTAEMILDPGADARMKAFAADRRIIY